MKLQESEYQPHIFLGDVKGLAARRSDPINVVKMWLRFLFQTKSILRHQSNKNPRFSHHPVASQMSEVAGLHQRLMRNTPPRRQREHKIGRLRAKDSAAPVDKTKSSQFIWVLVGTIFLKAEGAWAFTSIGYT